MARKKKDEFTLTASGFEYDKELSRVPIKVLPALQALIANQHELIEVTRKYAPDKFIFLKAHEAELAEVEETVAKAYAKYCERKEDLRAKRKEKEKSIDSAGQSTGPDNFQQQDDKLLLSDEEMLDELAATISPGLPSSRLLNETSLPAEKKETDVRRVAIGASIKALSSLLGRGLTAKEIAVIEKQVDEYL